MQDYYFIHFISAELSPDLKEKNYLCKQWKQSVASPHWCLMRVLVSGERDRASAWAEPAVGLRCNLSEQPPSARKWALPFGGHVTTSYTDKGICSEQLCLCQRGLLEIAKFYFYLLFGDDLNTPRCQIINRKKPAFGFCYQRRELRLFFSLTLFFFFFLTAQYLGWIPVQVITFCLPKFPCNSNWASCSSLPS